ncbi:MAG: cysteine hydrolase family protein [Gemmatimonas sp.]
MIAFRSAIAAAATIAMMSWASFAEAQQALPNLPPLDKTLSSSETALIVVDFQNSFASPKGEHYPRFEKIYKETRMLEISADLVKQARALGIQVVHVTEGYTPDYRELDWGNGGQFHRSQIVRQAWKSGTWDVELADSVKPGPNDRDIVLPDRKTLSGFGGNGLDYILKSRGIRNVAVMGYTSDICVYATTLAAYDLGYRVFAITDAMVGADDAAAREMLRYNYPKLARVLTAKDFVGMFPTRKPS